MKPKKLSGESPRMSRKKPQKVKKTVAKNRADREAIFKSRKNRLKTEKSAPNLSGKQSRNNSFKKLH
jgi:hypothetical protein